jgi:hypothetical protein
MKRFWLSILLCIVAVIFYTGYNNNSNRVSITEQQYSIPEVKAHIKNLFITNQKDTGELFDLLVNAAMREKEYALTHEVFYHAQSRTWLFLNLLRTGISEWLDQERVQDFMYLREPSKKFNFNQPVTDVVIERGILNIQDKFPDKDPIFGNILLSVNLSMVGNALYEGESLFDFFLKNYSINPSSYEVIYSILNEWLPETRLNSLSPELFEQCIQRYEELFSFLETGVIYQIFIRQEYVGNIAYLSKYGGRFYFNDPSPAKQAEYIQDAIRESKQQPTLATNKYQARLLCDLHTVLNPQSGVKIFTTCLPSQQKQFDESCTLFKDFLWQKLDEVKG